MLSNETGPPVIRAKISFHSCSFQQDHSVEKVIVDSHESLKYTVWCPYKKGDIMKA